jgi:hypothetical protein
VTSAEEAYDALGDCQWFTKSGDDCKRHANCLVGSLGICWQHEEVAKDVYYSTLDRLSFQ